MGTDISKSTTITDSAIRTAASRRNWLRRSLAVFAAAAVVAGGALAVQPTEAQASAYGCGFWNPFTAGGLKLASGQYCVTLAGQGTFVDYVYGGFVSAGNVCNYNVTAEFFDSSSRWYMTRSSPIRYGCTRANAVAGSVSLRSYVRRGFMCSTLKQNGARVTSVCHNIY